MRDGWTETTLGDVAKASWGNTTVTKKQYQESGFTAFSASGPDGFVDWYEHDGEGIVLSAIGALCGKTWLAEGKWTPIKNTIWIKSNSANCLTEYLFLQTKSPSLWPIRGQAQPFISLGDVRLVEILLPPIAEQQRIVDVVSSVDAYIDALQQQVDAARTARNAVLHELLSIGGNDWAETTLGEVAETRLGKMLSATSNLDVGSLLPYLRNANVRWGKIDLSDLNEMFFSEREIEILSLKEGDVLICEGGEPGRSAYLDRDLPGVLFQKAVHRVRCTSVLRPKYLVYWMEFQTRNSKIEDFLTSTTIAHLTGEKLRQLPIFLPSLIEQDGTVTVVESFDQLIDQGEETLNRAKSLRSGLLSDLLSGEHEIPVSYDIFLEAA